MPYLEKEYMLKLAAVNSLSQHEMSSVIPEVQSKGPDREAFLSPTTHFRLPMSLTSFDLSFYRFVQGYIYSESMPYRNVIRSSFLLFAQDV
jgi:hypothetical protein